MPTWAEMDTLESSLNAERKEENRKGIRSKGAAFIRQPGQKLPPYLQAQKENKRRIKEAAERKKYEAEQDAVAQAQKAMILMDLRKQGMREDYAEQEADKLYKKNVSAQAEKTLEEMKNEARINDEATRIFNAWDDDGDGQLNPAELRQALALAGFNTNTDLVEEITDEFDTNGDGMIDMDEFKIMLHVLYKGARRRGVFDNVKSWFVDNPYGVYGNDVLTDAEIDAYKQIFHDADESGDMLLDEAELQSLLVESGFMHQQREFVYDAMRTMDTSGDGAIDFGEFLEFMVKIKTNKAKKASALASLGLESLLTGGPEQAPPLPKVMEPGYFKVARYVPMLAPSFEKRWCEMSTDGKLLIAESRGAVMRMKEKGVAAGAASMNGRAYDRNHCTAIDLAYVDEIRTSPSGNASGCKLDLITLTDLWYFKSETREVCNAWIKELLVWREHCAFKHYALNRGLPFHDVGEKVKKSKKSRRNGDGFFSLFMPSPLLLGASSTAALPTKKERGATTNGSAARRKSRNSSGLRSREQSQSQALTGVARNLDGGNSFVGGSERRSAGSESGLGRKSRQSSDRAQRQSSEGGGQRRSLSEYSAATSRTSMTRSDGYSEDPGSETDVEEAEY